MTFSHMLLFSKFSAGTILGLTFGVLLAGYAVFAFQAPTQAPPGGNVPAPVNVGPDAQTKQGILWLNSGLAVDGGLLVGRYTTASRPDPCTAGTLIFDTTEDRPYICSTAGWRVFAQAPIDNDKDGFISIADGGTDCDDNNANIFQNRMDMILDVDADGYSAGSATTRCVGAITTIGGRTYYNDTSDSNDWLLSTDALGADCDDNNSSKWRNRYYDGDGDTFGAGSPVCVGDHAGYVDNNADCYDSSATAFPGQTAYFITHRGDGSYDYDCNDSETKDPTSNCLTTYPLPNQCVGWGGHGGYRSSIPACGQSGAWSTCGGWTLGCSGGLSMYAGSCSAGCPLITPGGGNFQSWQIWDDFSDYSPRTIGCK